MPPLPSPPERNPALEQLGCMFPHLDHEIASGVDITQPSRREQLKLLQTKAPVLASFILKHYCGHSLACDVCRLVVHLRYLIVAPFVSCEPDFPPPGEPNPLLFFPNLPQVWGKRMYKTDDLC